MTKIEDTPPIADSVVLPEIRSSPSARLRLEKGDTLLVFSSETVWYTTFVWGTLAAGGVVSSVNPGYSVDELMTPLKAGTAIATQRDQLPVTLEATKRVGILELSRYSLRGTFRAISHGDAGIAAYGGRKEVEDRALAILPFLLNFGQSDITALQAVLMLEKSLTVVVHLNFYLGIPTFILPRFRLDHFCAALERYITHAAVAPLVLQSLVSNSHLAAEYILISLQLMTPGAAPLSPDLVHALYEKLKLRESLLFLGSVGRLMPNMTARYVAAEDHDPSSAYKELWVKGPNVFLEYMGDEKAT
ncbi:hypothetical protein N7520_005310 [Penicillium odoratum]|uniref:uncharacterized protein n=1 Tax=Penicillium odoratum TaxID=1167516 RepID=UPI002546BB4E|nr:uncharacterized protein N7520_005310 [Penicillium odoratum]KAJ5765751.1 hypothetical protein N7520_005310 [Penicillium odoratum]